MRQGVPHVPLETIATSNGGTLNVLAYKGKSVTIRFLGQGDSSLQTSFVIDDVALTTS